MTAVCEYLGYEDYLEQSGILKGDSKHRVVEIEKGIDLKNVSQMVAELLPKRAYHKNYLIDIHYEYDPYMKKKDRTYKDSTTSEYLSYMSVKTNRIDVITFNKIVYNIIDPTYRIGTMVVMLSGNQYIGNVINFMNDLPMNTILIVSKIK